MLGHVNLSAHATDEQNLYEIWDKDLRKCVTLRVIFEWGAVIWAIACVAGVINPGVELFIAVFAAMVYAALRLFIDESNANYLMHGWDLRAALDGIRRTKP
jgi:hypothetical protein